MSKVFDSYARYYDLLYQDKDYVAESEYVASHIRGHMSQAVSILELGCGTGAHAVHLARMGYIVHGVDMSDEMLARAEARKATLPADVAARLSFSLGDVRTVRTGEQFDVVLSLFHVMSYQTTNIDLAAMFETAAMHLIPGGLFIFDYWYGPAVLSQRPEVRVRRLGDSEISVTRIAEPKMFSDKNMVEVNYEVLIEDRIKKEHAVTKESHEMRYLFQPEIEKYAEKDFTIKKHCAWMKLIQPTICDWASVSFLKKN
jgi:SAM-dependent methyltransferase